MYRILITNLGRSRKQVVKRRTKDDKEVTRIASNFQDDEHIHRGAAMLKVPPEFLRNCLIEFDDNPTANNSWEIGGDDLEEFIITMRGINDKDGPTQKGYTPEILFEAVIKRTPENAKTFKIDSEPVVTWNNIEACCAVDVDVEEDSRIGKNEFNRIVSTLQPQPRYAWLTHGGGLRLIYFAIPPYSATELSAAAVIVLQGQIVHKRIELKRITRHPAFPRQNGAVRETCGPIREGQPTTTVTSVERQLRRFTGNDTKVQEWLTARGLQIGVRYTHERCPIKPLMFSKTPCVVVTDTGIHCYHCESHGYTRGSRKPGHFPYAALIEGENSTASTLEKCVENFTHWQHVRYMLESKYDLVGDVARYAYSAYLKTYHNTIDDPRIRLVFTEGKNLLRLNDDWVNEHGEPYTRFVHEVIRPLPACYYLDKTSGKLKPDLSKINAMYQPRFDLTNLGYPSLTPVHGIRIYGHYGNPTHAGDIPFVIQQKELRDTDKSAYRPQYVELPKDDEECRKGIVDHAWEVITKIFPKLNRQLITYLICQRGYAESGLGMPIITYLTGPSSVGKSQSVNIAAAIVGDGNVEGVWSDDEGRVRNIIREAYSKGSFVTFSELGKKFSDAMKFHQSLDFILQLTSNSESHKLYTGPVAMGRVPVIVLTDISIDNDIRSDIQIGRRTIHIELSEPVDWSTSTQATIGAIKYLRTHSEETADACNVIVSDIIDRHFRAPAHIESIARDIGYTTMEKAAEEQRESIAPTLRRFFEKICEHTEKEDKSVVADNLRYSGEAVKVTLTEDTELVRLWESLRDSDKGAGQYKSRKIESAPLTTIFGYEDGNTNYLHFRSYKLNSVTMLFSFVGYSKAGTSQLRNHRLRQYMSVYNGKAANGNGALRNGFAGSHSANPG